MVYKGRFKEFAYLYEIRILFTREPELSIFMFLLY